MCLVEQEDVKSEWLERISAMFRDRRRGRRALCKMTDC